MKLLNFLLQLISSFFVSKKANQEENPTLQVDWGNPYAHISEYFTVRDALYLPSWQVYHTPSEKEKANILKLAKKLDLLCAKFGKME